MMYKVSKSIRTAGKKTAGVIAAVGLAVTNPVVFATNVSNLDVNDTLNKTMTLIFQFMTWGGIVIAAAGVIQIVRALASGGDSDPHTMSRGISLTIGGVVMIVARAIIGSLIGGDVTNINYVTN